MPTKTYQGDGRYLVTFHLPSEAGAGSGSLVGDFNDWDDAATPLEPGDDGSLEASVVLEAGRSYRYRYFVGGDRWENDWAADDYVDNEFGGSDSVVVLEEAPTPIADDRAPEAPPPAKKPRASRAKKPAPDGSAP